MLSRSRFTAVAFLVFALLMSTAPVCGQTGSGDWSRVSSLPLGTKISIKLKSGKSVMGRLNNASDSNISVDAKNGQDIKKDDVQSVYVVSKKSALKATLIGTGVGAGAGGLLGAVGGNGDDSFDELDHAITAGLTVLGAGVGAITGFLIGKSGNKKELIYQAR